MARTAKLAHQSVEERRARGREARIRTPPSSHEGWAPAAERPDPVALLKEQDATREPDLVPVRHGRMLISPLAFYRGAAKLMAADLKGTPTAGLNVQLCGDAHLSNFGLFASPERRLLFDLNDFDETLPGPFEYDVKRMAASFMIAGRSNGLSKANARTATATSVLAYRKAMARFATMGTMDIWYAHLAEDELPRRLRDAAGHASKTRKGAKAAKQAEKTARKEAAKARTRDSLQALSKLTEQVAGRYRIVSQPPIIVPARDLEATYGIPPDTMEQLFREQFRAYRATLRDDHRQLLERFEPVDMARKVVGVGSVGTLAFIVLLQGRDQHDPLFLQLKEATNSVLEDHLPASRYRHQGQRVVCGQRLMQAASDIYLGWTQARLPTVHHFYWRQLRDMKGSPDIEAMAPTTLTFYARACGWTLARAHARSGDPIAIAAYLGEDDQFDRSITHFSERYADQNDRDHQGFVKAIRSGRLQALEGL
jgi:uncharacterized protein (DUF2252 family)